MHKLNDEEPYSDVGVEQEKELGQNGKISWFTTGPDKTVITSEWKLHNSNPHVYLYTSNFEFEHHKEDKRITWLSYISGYINNQRWQILHMLLQ